MRETVRSGLITQTASGATARCCRLLPANVLPGKIRGAGARPSRREGPTRGRCGNAAREDSVVRRRAADPDAPGARRDVGRCRGRAKGPDDRPCLRVDLRHGPVVGIEHPDASLPDADGGRRGAERNALDHLARLGVERAQTRCLNRLVVASGEEGRSSDRSREHQHAHNNDRPWVPARGARARGSRPRRRLGGGERRILLEDPVLESSQALARLDAKLLRERAPPVLVALQRLRLPSRAVQRKHELASRPFAKGMLGDQRLELDDELIVASELEIGFDPLFLGRETELFESGDLGLREVGVPEFREGRAAPQTERLSQLLGGFLGLATRSRAPGLLERVVEDVGVELAALHAKAVSVAVRLERLARRAERPAKSGDQRLQRLERGRGRALAPEGVDKRVGGQDLVGVDQQDGEELTLLPPRHLDLRVTDENLERAKDPRFHRASSLVVQPTMADLQPGAQPHRCTVPTTDRAGRSTTGGEAMRNLANITALAVALALSAGAGMAIGSTRPDDRATHGQGAIVLEQRTDVVRPDDRARHGQGAIVLERRSDAVRPDDRATHGQGAIEFEQVARADQVPVIARGWLSVSAGHRIRLARRRDRRGCRARSRTDRRWERRRTPPRSRTGVLVAASARPRT